MLTTFARPYDWTLIDSETRTTGAAILQDVLDQKLLASLNQEIDSYLATATLGKPETGTDSYDQFLGHNTIRLHGLVEKFESAAELIADPEIVSWAERLIAPLATQISLNAGELIQIQPGEPRQAAHRDSDSWPLPIGADPYVVNAIYALDEFTLTNGATWLAPESWGWHADRRASEEEYLRAVMGPGDAIIFRGDLVHRGGANDSDTRRRAISISYAAGWLRTVENTYFNHSPAKVLNLPESLQQLLGYRLYDGSAQQSGMLGLYENGDPRKYGEA